MVDKRPVLEVGFAIDATGVAMALDAMVQEMDAGTARIVADARQIEKAIGGMLHLKGAAFSTMAFGKAGSADLANSAGSAAQTHNSPPQRTEEQVQYIEKLREAAELWKMISENISNAGKNIGDSFGRVGAAIGGVVSTYAAYHAQELRAKAERQKATDDTTDAAKKQSVEELFRLQQTFRQVRAYGDMAKAAKGFFAEKSRGYKAMEAAEKVYRAVEFALSVRSMAQDVIKTVSSIANSGARSAAAGAEGVASQSKLPFPFNIAAMAATAAALIAAGISISGSFGGSGSAVEPANKGTGTVFGDSAAKSESIKNAIDSLRAVDTLTSNYAREMMASLKSIESQIGGFTNIILRSGEINASAGVVQGFKANGIGSALGGVPLIGGLLKSLFGTTTTVTGAGLYGGSQSIGQILNSGFHASTYSDVEQKKKFLGITTGRSTSTVYGGADPALAQQFTLILRSFNDAIVASAAPLGAATGDIQARLNSFVVSIGKIDLKGLTGEQIQERLSAIFGAAADRMANAAFPGMARFQKVGEGAFETMVRVASTVDAVSNSLKTLGSAAQSMTIDAKLGLAAQFDSVSDLTSAVESYFQGFYTQEEQRAAKMGQLSQVFGRLGYAMPSTLAGFRHLVEAQNLHTAAGQATYATLLRLAPAFADLQRVMEGGKSAADIATERMDLQRQLLDLQGNATAIRAQDLAKLDPSNRALQEQIWAIRDGQEAAKRADELRKAWQSVGDTIEDEVRRIRGIADAGGSQTYATLLGQFNAATASARAGDQDAAKQLPQLSQALLTAAGNVATSRQEMDRVRAQTAASLEVTRALIQHLSGTGELSDAALLNAGQSSHQANSNPSPTESSTLREEMAGVRAELRQLRSDNNVGHAVTAGNTGRIARKLEEVTSESGGRAIAVEIAA